jgi:hypothetical protein
MSARRSGLQSVVTVVRLIAAVAATAAADYEIPADRSVAAALPPELAQGPHYRVREPIVADGYM